MIIEQALFVELKTAAGITALVGTRVYPLILPQNAAFPAITFQKVSGSRSHSQSGPSNLAHPRFQISCWAKGDTAYPDAKGLAAQVRQAIDGFKGTMGGAGGVDVQSCELVSEVDGYVGESYLYVVHLDFVMWHRE